MSNNNNHPGDRNAKARAEFDLQGHKNRQRAFAQDLAAGRTGLVDRIGQAVEIQALVLFKVPPAFDLLWAVEDIAPSLDPSKPVGALNVKLSVTVPLLVPAGQRQVSLVRLGHSDDEAPGRGVQPPELSPEQIAAAEAGPMDPAGEPPHDEGKGTIDPDDGPKE